MNDTIITQNQALLAPLSHVIGVAGKRSSSPILENVLVVADANGLSFTTTDLEQEMTGRISFDNRSGFQGNLTVNCRKFYDICKALPSDADLKLKVNNKDNSAQVACGRSRFKLATLPVTDFPSLPALTDPVNITLPANILKALIGKVHFAMATQDVRYYLNGALLKVEGRVVHLVATDGHRLALAETTLEADAAQEIEVILPRKAVQELSKLLPNSDTEVSIDIASQYVSFRLPNVTFSAKLIDGKFPSYERVLPGIDGTLVVFDRLMLSSTVTRAMVLANEKTKGMRMELEGRKVTFFCSNPEAEEAQEELEVAEVSQNTRIAFGFNARYLLDVLGSISTERVMFVLHDGNTACLISPEGDGLHKNVIMPMRL